MDTVSDIDWRAKLESDGGYFQKNGGTRCRLFREQIAERLRSLFLTMVGTTLDDVGLYWCPSATSSFMSGPSDGMCQLLRQHWRSIYWKRCLTRVLLFWHVGNTVHNLSCLLIRTKNKFYGPLVRVLIRLRLLGLR